MDVGWRDRFKAPWGVGGGWGDREIERRERGHRRVGVRVSGLGLIVDGSTY